MNIAVAEMDKATQQNAATAEESASAAEELTAQSEQMNQVVAELSVLVGGNADGGVTGPGRATSQLNASDHTFHQIAGAVDVLPVNATATIPQGEQ